MAQDESPKSRNEDSSGPGNALWRIPSWFPQQNSVILEKLKVYHGEILRFNLKINLISRNTEREADAEHFADCLLASESLISQKLPPKVYDIGSGNGFPGLILALMDPTREFNLVESDGRKCEFLKHMIHVLQLQNVKIVNARVESLAEVGLSCAVSRGFASISKTLLVCNKLFPKGGRVFHLKGRNWSTEIADLPSQLISVWKPHLVAEYTIPTTQVRCALVMTEKMV